MINLIADFAKRFFLDKWDWVAVIVAFCSLCVAMVSLIIAYRTFKSQKQTELNTMPIINTRIQEFLLNEFMLNLLDGQTQIGALWHLLCSEHFMYYPSEQLLERNKISIDTIHTELFYNNPDYYHCINGLVNMTKDYNQNIDVLNSHLRNSSISIDLLNNEFETIVKQNETIASTWIKVMSIVYGYDKKKLASVFDNILKTAPQDEEYELKYFGEEGEIYTEFCEDARKKKLILNLMDSRVKLFIAEYKNYLIKK